MVRTTLTLKEKIMKYLLENQEQSHSIGGISSKLKTDYKNTFQAINNLPNLISKVKIGSVNLIKIKLVPKQEIYSIENKRTKIFLNTNPKLKLIQKDIENINYPFFIVLIFGSTLKKTNTKYSDIDICIISDSEIKKKELINQLNLLSLNIEIHDFTISEFISMFDKKEDSVANEIVKNNLILYGIENYYNLISKWTKRG